MKPVNIRKYRTLGLICIFTSIAGVIYEIVDTGALSFMSVLIGLPIGLVYAVLELYVFTNRDLWINKLSFIKLILVKAFLYTTFAFVFINLVGLINGFLDGKSKDEFYESLVSSDQLMLLVVLALYLVIAFFLQINRLLGEGKLLKYLLGKYYQPVSENRIFMFLDIKSSTHIAEKLGNKTFYSWLNDFFHEISDPVTSTKAEIYQYVGDEVVFTWEISNGFKDWNCIKIYFQILENVESNRDYYNNKYGVVPEFRAAVHFGDVISAQIGDIKREIIYNGDVLNTTARIIEQCKTYREDLIVSGDILANIGDDPDYVSESLGTVILRGKEQPVAIFGIQRRQELVTSDVVFRRNSL